jgi:hypothetical protein
VQGWSRDLVEERTSALRPRPPVEDSSLGRLVEMLVGLLFSGWMVRIGIDWGEGRERGKGPTERRRRLGTVMCL